MSIHVDPVSKESTIADVNVAIGNAGAGIQESTNKAAGKESVQRQADGAANNARRELAGEEQGVVHSDVNADLYSNIAAESLGGVASVADLVGGFIEDIKKTGDDGKSKDASKMVKQGLASNPKGMFKIETAFKGPTKMEGINLSSEKLAKFSEDTKGVKSHEKNAAVIGEAVKEELKIGVANKQVLASALQLRASAAPAPGGSSQGASINALNKMKATGQGMQLAHMHHTNNPLGNGPPPPTGKDTTDTDSGWGSS